MNQTMETKIGNYEIGYRLVNEHGIYYIAVEEKEDGEIVKTGRFGTSIESEEVATEMLKLLCENQVGAVHVPDILCEFGLSIV